MIILLRIVLAMLVITYLTIIMINIKKNRLHMSVSFFWIITGIILLIMLCIPNLVQFISNTLGFETTSNMLFCASIFIAFYVMFKLTIKISENYIRIIKLIQEVALLKKEVKDLKEKLYIKDED